MERMRGWGGVYGGLFFLFLGGKLNAETKYDEGLRWPPFNILHATTNQKQAGVTKGGWDCEAVRERDGNDKPLAEGDEDNDDEYEKHGDIPNDGN